MNHLPPIITDLAMILAAAGVSTLIFSRLRQPVVLGYLIAGFAAGPHFPFLPTVVDSQGVHVWAEIGVIFLLFGLGLEFSFKKLAKVGKSAFIAALFEIITMTTVGYLFGRAIGWTAMDSIFLGAILSMSSTTIIIRAFDEARLKGQAFAKLVFGILIVEDLMAILLMVILAAISIPGSFSGSNLAFLSGRLVFFLVLWFVVGIYLVPSLLKRVREHLSNEIMLIVSIALCFLMVVLATTANFSAAIGAFIMGSILAETEEGERIEHLILPVKDLFAAVFFVSVGMMIDPAVLREHFGVVIMITILTIVGKLFGSGFGAVLSGRSLKQSTKAGMSLAQIGEFSFIIASLGVSLKVVSDYLYPIVIAVSAVTTFTTPYMIRFSGPMYSWVEARLPHRFLDVLAQYERAMASDGKENALSLLWRTYGFNLLLNSVVVIAIAVTAAKLGLPLMPGDWGDSPLVRIVASILTLLACSPFLFAIVLRAPKKLSTEEASTLLRLRSLQPGIVIFRLIVGLALGAFVINQFSTTRTLPLVLLIATPIFIFAFRRLIERLYATVEGRFLMNLNAKELAEVESLSRVPQLAPWSATLVKAVLTSDSPIAGKTLQECGFRSLTGATVAMIDRGRRRIFAPSRAERVLPNDELFLIGTDEQIAAAQKMIQPEEEHEGLQHEEMFNLESFLVSDDSPFANRSIRDVGLGDQFGALIVGVERDGQRILNPESSVTLQPGSLVWVFGHKQKIRELQRNSGAPETKP